MSTSRIARRNLGRNGKRTALALCAIALAQCAVVLIDGLLQGYGDALVDAVTGPLVGHVQLHAPRWRQEQSMDLTLTGVDGLLSRLRAQQGVEQASARIYAPVLVARGQQGYMGVVIGLQPAQEASARGLLGDATHPLSGHQVQVGAALAHQMGLSPGDELAIVGQGVDGSIANDLYRVAGVVQSPVELVQGSGLLMTLPQAQALFAMPDEAHEITLHGRDPDQAPAIAQRIAAQPDFRGLEIKTWSQLAPELNALLDLNQAFSWIMLLLVFVAAAAGVANTMLMATFERNHELGMLLALGCTPQRIVSMIVQEALWLGVLGVGIGTLVGVAINALLASHGIDLAALGGSQGLSELSFGGINQGLRIVPRSSGLTVLGGVLAVTATSLLSALWPALHAARLQPVEAMRA